MRKGFTLVELSIVLVIIGLLTGGILIGQSLIQSVKSSRLISDITQYNVAVRQFRQKFRTPPADSPIFTPAGNNDNQLANGANGNATCAAAPNTTMSNLEWYQFWAHLSQSGMLKQRYRPYSPSGAAGCNGTDTRNNPEYAKQLCGVTWPCTELDQRAIAVGQTSTYAIFGTKALPNYNLGIQFNLTPENLVAFVTKIGPLQLLTNTYYNSLPDWSTGNNTGVYHYMCFKNGIGNPASCTSSDVAFGRVFYAFDLN